MDSQTSKRLETWMPLDVFENLTAFAKAWAGTGLGKFDYSVAIRILLLRSQMLDRLDEFEERLEKLESKSYSQEQESEIPKGYYETKTLGDKKVKGGI
jgi:hypothetical protein